MSLDIWLYDAPKCEKCGHPGLGAEVFSANITHNLSSMADAVDLYPCVWRPDEIGIKSAGEIIPKLSAGINILKSNPNHYRTYEPENGWGLYNDFIPWLERYLEACKQYPDATIRVSR